MELYNISSLVQRIAEAIKSVIDVDVTIIDNKLNRIAATGDYVKNIGSKLSENCVFAYALDRGEEFIIDEPRTHEACIKCDEKKICKEHAQVCCPIKLNDKIIGVIGLIAFSKSQKDSIINNQQNLLEFLTRMADLIATKVEEQNKTDEINLLARELEVLLDSIDRGVISVDNYGKILHYNSKALKILNIDNHEDSTININKFLKSINIKHILDNKTYIMNKQFQCTINKITLRGIYNVNPILIGKEVVGLVLTFNKMNEIINVVNEVTGANMEMDFRDIIGESSSITLVKDYAKKAAKSSSTILIQGESGTGKELFARAIHFTSERRNCPFIPINCAAIPENLLESELFGYDEGAFTGARKGGKTGKFELANRGTIFLDEIGDMALHLQTKLLRVIQENVIERVGGKRFTPIDVRIVTATNKDLERKVLEGEFRDDLYYRLNVIPIYIPPLRERLEDIRILAYEFLNKFNYKLGKSIKGIDEKVINLFMHYDWPGNVRELENVIEYTVNMAANDYIETSDLPTRVQPNSTVKDRVRENTIIPIHELEKKEIRKAIEKYGRSKNAIDKASEALGISRATIYRKLNKYNI